MRDCISLSPWVPVSLHWLTWHYHTWGKILLNFICFAFLLLKVILNLKCLKTVFLMNICSCCWPVVWVLVVFLIVFEELCQAGCKYFFPSAFQLSGKNCKRMLNILACMGFILHLIKNKWLIFKQLENDIYFYCQ